MNLLSNIWSWLGRLVHRPADLFDIASGIAAPGFVVLAIANTMWNGIEDGDLGPSLSFVTGVAPLWFWLVLIGLCGAAQPLILHYDNPRDPRHPFVQPTKWTRAILATVVGGFFFSLLWSQAYRIGPHQMQSLLGMIAGMNVYIMSHVLTRPSVSNVLTRPVGG